MQPNIKNTFNVIVQVVIILIVATGSIWIASLFSKEEVEPAVVSCPLDTDSYQETKAKKNIAVLNDKSSYGVNGSFTGHDYNVVLKRTGLQSQIACGYLFFKVSVGDKPIELASEGLYMILSDSRQFGGHIMAGAEYVINTSVVNNKTEILIPLGVVSHDGTTRTNIKKSDWVSLLNVGDQISFNLALNTVRTLGRIDSVEIAYKCWNPQTGQENSDCGLEVVN